MPNGIWLNFCGEKPLSFSLSLSLSLLLSWLFLLLLLLLLPDFLLLPKLQEVYVVHASLRGYTYTASTFRHLDGLNLGIRKKCTICIIKRPISWQNQMGLDLGSLSAMLQLHKMTMKKMSLLSPNYSNQFFTTTALMVKCLDQIDFLGFDYAIAT